jgi:hypothetical protein
MEFGGTKGAVTVDDRVKIYQSDTISRGLQTSGPSGTSRVAACWYSSDHYTISVNTFNAPGGTEDVSLYLMDWDKLNRAEGVAVEDADTGTPWTPVT